MHNKTPYWEILGPYHLSTFMISVALPREPLYVLVKEISIWSALSVMTVNPVPCSLQMSYGLNFSQNRNDYLLC